MPTLGFHVPEGSPLEDAVKKRADDFFGGKVSSYVRDAVERDLSGRSPAHGTSIELIEMALRFSRIMTGAQLTEVIAEEKNADVIKALLTPLREKSMAELHRKWLAEQDEQKIEARRSEGVKRGGQIRKIERSPDQKENSA